MEQNVYLSMSLFKPVPFHDNVFRLGMPANYTVQQNGQVALTFLQCHSKCNCDTRWRRTCCKF